MATDRCQMVISGTCIQHCHNQSCDCGVTDSNHGYNECYQASAGSKCRAITCSSETCYQKCHNCHMKCTSDVSFCRQRCLSGACSFTCDAQHCEQECTGENCQNTVFDNCHLILPLNYLVILAGILFVITALKSSSLTAEEIQVDTEPPLQHLPIQGYAEEPPWLQVLASYHTHPAAVCKALYTVLNLQQQQQQQQISGVTESNTEKVKTYSHIVYDEINFPITTLIELFSWKVLTRSVAISIPRISTALLSSPCFLTNSSLAKMAAALPSDVGLK
ncbi:hypothetical protein pdam_00005309, partial [Pocillopora damicornis]